MRKSKLSNQLDLLLLLSDTRGYTIAELCERINISRRNLYYLFDFLREAGFVLFKKGDLYHIDRRSPFFAQLLKTIQFSDNEMRTIYNLLLMAGTGSEVVNQLRHKLDNAYNFSVNVNSPQHRHILNNVKLISTAILNKRMVRIVGYSSPHSQTVSDRIVEPFFLMNNNQDVRCYELKTKMNKTFRINRMERVEVVDTPWLYEDQHRQIFTDLFMFSGEERMRIKLRLGQLSRNLFLEEYPQGFNYLSPIDDNHWLLDIEVSDYRGIGRFVLGLLSDIQIIENDKFTTFIRSQLLHHLEKLETT